MRSQRKQVIGSFKFMRNIIVALGKVFTSLGTRKSNLVMPKSVVTGRTNYAIGAQGEMLRWILFPPLGSQNYIELAKVGLKV